MVSLRAHLARRLAARTAWFGMMCIASWLLPSVPARAVDTNEVLQGWLAAQTNLHTWQADFVQTRTLKTLKQPLVTTGRTWFAPPNRFRWELGTPAQTIALRRADEMLVIYPALKRAERYPLDSRPGNQWRETLALFEVGFPQNRAELESRFRILALTESNAGWLLILQPKSATARRMMQQIKVGLAADGFALASTELVFADGSTMRNDFTNTVLNTAFDPALFNWYPPDGFKVSEPLGP